MRFYILTLFAFAATLSAKAQSVATNDTLSVSADTTNVSAATVSTPSVPQQGLRFGYCSYSEVLKALPEYTIAMAKLDSIKAIYDKELTDSEEDLNKRFTEYIDGQTTYPKNILLKRQKELQLLINQSIEFKEGAQRLLTSAEQELMKPLNQRMKEVLNKIGKDRNYAFILNTDNNSCPFVNDEQGEDITNVVLTLLETNK